MNAVGPFVGTTDYKDSPYLLSMSVPGLLPASLDACWHSPLVRHFCGYLDQALV